MPKKTLKGEVVSDKMQKTVVVSVTTIKAHPKYKKRMKVTKRYKAHYESLALKTGDIVIIEECAPISKDKNWLVKEIVKSKKSPAEENILQEVK